MKIENYLPQLAKKFPNLYIEGIEQIIQKLKLKIKITEVSKYLEIKENTLRDILNNKSRCSLDILRKLIEFFREENWNRVYENCTVLGGKTFTNKIKIPKKLTPEFAYMAGALRDGALSTYKSELVISQLNKKWLEKKINPFMKKIFQINCKIYGPREKDKCYYIKFRSVALFAIIKTILNWEKGKWKTPQIILKSPLELQKEYIKGFWDAEGCNNKKGGLEIYQAWPSINKCPPLSDIKDILWKFKIDSWFTKPQKGTNKPVHRLYIPKRYKELFFQTFQPSKL